jgi:hypothetical protein
MPRSRQELLDALAVQRRHLAASCAAYDAGDHSEALRLATCVYNIVHDGGKIRSIMTQLGIKEKHLFFASNVKDGADVHALADRYTPLVELERLYIQPEFVALCTYFQNRNAWFGVRGLPFERWWNRDIIFFHGPLCLTRRQLVFTLRNQEGGSHFDQEVRNPNFVPLQQKTMMWVMGRGLAKTIILS